MDDIQRRALMVIDADVRDLDGAVAEFTVTSDHVVIAEIRIPGPAVP